ncbi:MAG TPA: EamA family transporter [Rhodobacteraceae bacterium]|jgi:DME family drug/metabolite transporter|nr:EamA family transporter [Paracoccaceae bacterium]HBV55581.1 EamA family transporter [Paracoccaceae bacterium]
MRYGLGVMLVLIAGLLWSLQGLIFRQILEAGSWAVLFWRSVGMMPVLLVFLAYRAGGSPWPAVRRTGMSGVIGALGLVAAFGGAIVAIQSTTIANAVFLFAVSPFLTALLGWIVLRERVGRETWVAMAIAKVGVFVMVRGGLANGALLGNVAALISALGFAVFTVSLRHGGVRDTLSTVFVGAVFASVAGLCAGYMQGQVMVGAAADIGWAMMMGAVTLSGGMVLYTLGSRVVPAAQLALLSNLEVLLAPFWVWLFLGETATVNTLLGGAILLAAVSVNAVSGVRGERARA